MDVKFDLRLCFFWISILELLLSVLKVILQLTSRYLGGFLSFYNREQKLPDGQ